MAELRALTFEEILGLDPDVEGAEEVAPGFVLVTARSLGLLHLQDCAQQLAMSSTVPLRLAQAAKSVHLALQSALTGAVAGSMSIGAYPPKLRRQYYEYLTAGPECAVTYPQSDRVMSFEELLEHACNNRCEWTGQNLTLTGEDWKALRRLTTVRHRVEHPRPDFFLIEPKFITSTLPLAARLTLWALDQCPHHWEAGERELALEAVAAIQTGAGA